MPDVKTVMVEVPDVAYVVVVGSVQCGKSVLLARIERLLRDEFGANTVSRTLDQERRLSNPDFPAVWETDVVGKTLWVLSEHNTKPA